MRCRYSSASDGFPNCLYPVIGRYYVVPNRLEAFCLQISLSGNKNKFILLLLIHDGYLRTLKQRSVHCVYHERFIVTVICIFLFFYSIRHLTKLQKLNMSLNRQLHTIPDWIGEITSLNSLSLQGCYITTIPSR